MKEIYEELSRARSKHPDWPTDPVHAVTVLAEEAGELQRAVLQAYYEGGSIDEVRKEAIQTGAMVLRFLENLGRYEWPKNGKPDWKDAPEWAQWLAMDEDGSWYWYAGKPFIILRYWECHSDSNTEWTGSTPNYPVPWQGTLESRPFVREGEPPHQGSSGKPCGKDADQGAEIKRLRAVIKAEIERLREVLK